MATVVKLGGSKPEEPKSKGKGEATAASAPGGGLALGGFELNRQTLMIGGGVLAVVLIAVVAFVVMGQNRSGAVDAYTPPPAGADGGAVAGPGLPGNPNGGAAINAASMPGAQFAPPGAPGVPLGSPTPTQGVPAAGSDLPPAPGMFGSGGGPGTVQTSPGVGGAPVGGGGVQYGPKPEVDVPKPGGGSWHFKPRETPS